MCGKAKMKDAQSLNSSKESISIKTKTDRTRPLNSCEQSRQTEKGESIPPPKRIPDELKTHITFRPPTANEFSSILKQKIVKAIFVSHDGKKARNCWMTIGHPASLTTSISDDLRHPKITISSCGTRSSESKTFEHYPKLTLHFYSKEEDEVPKASYSATVKYYQIGKEITLHSPYDENAREDDTICGALYSCSDEGAQRTSTSFQSLERTVMENEGITLHSRGDKNSSELSDSSASSLYPFENDKIAPPLYRIENESKRLEPLSASARMSQSDQEITVYSSNDETVLSNDMSKASIVYMQYTSEPSNSAQMLIDTNKANVFSIDEENTFLPVFSFSPSNMYPDLEDIKSPYIYEGVANSSNKPSSSASMTEDDLEITVHTHSSCGENSRKDDTITGHLYLHTKHKADTNEATVLSKNEGNVPEPSFSDSPRMHPDPGDVQYPYNNEGGANFSTTLLASASIPENDEEINGLPSCDENTRYDKIIGLLYTCSDESANEPSTSSQTSERTFPGKSNIRLNNDTEHLALFIISSLLGGETKTHSHSNANEIKSLTSLPASIISQGNSEMTVPVI